MEKASRIEVFAMLTLVEDRLEAQKAELEVHRHATHHKEVRKLLKRYETFRRYLLGELWLMDREEAKEAEKETDDKTSGDIRPDNVHTDGDGERDEDVDRSHEDGSDTGETGASE